VKGHRALNRLILAAGEGVKALSLSLRMCEGAQVREMFPPLYLPSPLHLLLSSRT